ncbi:MAG: GntR family transcriptional regulator [Clostridiales bacterium]|nr:GntR family transcriptional regulator [Clostridiales bacterium]
MFQLDLKNGKPIYEQVVDKFKELIINGVLKPDDKIPSVRDLAQQLTINPNTIQKAYRELEYQGYIYSVQGLGSFISHPKTTIDHVKANQLKEQISSDIFELLYMGIGTQELKDFLSSILTSWKGGKEND